MDSSELEVGKFYRVKMHDCCIQGFFTSRLDYKEQPDIDGDLELTFENGVRLSSCGQCTFTEVE